MGDKDDELRGVEPAAPVRPSAPVAKPVLIVAPNNPIVNGAIQINPLAPLVLPTLPRRAPIAAPRAAPPIQVVNGAIQINPPTVRGAIPYTNMVNNKQLENLDKLGQLNYETWNWKILNIKEDKLNPNARETSVIYITDNKN